MAQVLSDCSKPVNELEEHLTPFQRKLYRVLSLNEVGDPRNVTHAYSLSLANDGQKDNASGYSFGWLQWDLHQQGDKSPAGKLLKNAVDDIKDDVLKQRAAARKIEQIGEIKIDDTSGFKDQLVKTIMKTTGKSDATVTAFKDLIDAELAAMSKRIDQASADRTRNIDEYTRATVNRITDDSTWMFVVTSEVAQLFIADVFNQFGPLYINFLLEFLNGGQTTILVKKKNAWVPFADVETIGEEFGIQELLMFSLSTPYGSGHPYDILRRFGNIVKVVSAQDIALTSEDATFFAEELAEAAATKSAYNKMFLSQKEFRELVAKACKVIDEEPPALPVAKPRTNKKKLTTKADNGLSHPHAAELAAWYQQDYYTMKHWNIASRLYHLNPHDDAYDG